MKFSLYISLLAIFSISCTHRSIIQRSSAKLPVSNELKSYALIIDENVPNSTELKDAIHKEMALKNYFHDPSHPDVLVMGRYYSQNIALLTGSTFYNSQGEKKLESGKYRTQNNALLLQLIETKSYATLWRGFSSSKMLPREPFQISYSTRALLHD